MNTRTENFPTCEGMTKRQLAEGIAAAMPALVADLMLWKRADLVRQYRLCA